LINIFNEKIHCNKICKYKIIYVYKFSVNIYKHTQNKKYVLLPEPSMYSKYTKTWFDRMCTIFRS
jgi:hypothetical protein